MRSFDQLDGDWTADSAGAIAAGIEFRANDFILLYRAAESFSFRPLEESIARNALSTKFLDLVSFLSSDRAIRDMNLASSLPNLVLHSRQLGATGF